MAAQLACAATTSRFSYRYQEQRISWNGSQYCSVKWNDFNNQWQTGANKLIKSVANRRQQVLSYSIFGNFEFIINSRLIYDGIKPLSKICFIYEQNILFVCVPLSYSIFGNFEFIINSRLIYDGIKPLLVPAPTSFILFYFWKLWVHN